MRVARTSLIVALASVLFVAPGTAKAQGTLDQSQTTYSNYGLVSGSAEWAQTFTAGLSGKLT
jgi:hypothetical protein